MNLAKNTASAILRMARQTGGMLLPLCCAILVSRAAAGDDAVRLADDFNGDIQNALAGYRNPFAARPSTAKSLRTAEVCRGSDGRSLRLEIDRRAAGFCGQWIHLFDMRADAPTFFDARVYSHLSLWVKGERGGERFDVQLADRRWIEKEDSIRLGNIADFLPGGVTTEWQEARVPLSAAAGLDLAQLGGLTLNFTTPGSAVVYIDDVTFKAHCRDGRAPVCAAAKCHAPGRRYATAAGNVGLVVRAAHRRSRASRRAARLLC